ncbi:DNA-binding transcriptional regulator [Thioclava sp. JM3]|uniref:sugar-binding transcriptional regulator n=1 Tax=unclassified Thioclava TaxID=2621713 RepID=UPI000B53F7BE|nr:MULTISPECIES: sugar-binding transcriptional regulator [unclassified Thioclava]OWY12597.1 DNA-binding transcriptional regulator [Thioclava sp. F34-6]OWY16908.1 DNA-binding transcriptional regulator [Thioclava sp. JM3]PWE49673.1 sugar-binding transcriptional regulator [Thioclava sp. NG1]
MNEAETSRDDEAARAGWLYYVGGMTQDQIAAELGVSRQRAQRLVSRAVSEGLVRVRIEHKIGACLELEAALMRRFGLQTVRVAPSLGERGDPATATAAFAATLLERILARSEPQVIAFGTGRSLSAMVNEVMQRPATEHKIVSLIGNIAPDGSASFYDVIMRMADKLRLPHYPMLVPVISETVEERAMFDRLKPVQAVKRLAAEADATFVGVGQLGEDAPVHKDGFVTLAELEELRAAGGVGELVGSFYDAQGNYITTPTTTRFGSFRIEPKRDAPVIGIAAGSSKLVAIRAALEGGLLNGLVTDEPTAQALLED